MCLQAIKCFRMQMMLPLELVEQPEDSGEDSLHNFVGECWCLLLDRLSLSLSVSVLGCNHTESPLEPVRVESVHLYHNHIFLLYRIQYERKPKLMCKNVRYRTKSNRSLHGKHARHH